MGRSPDLQMTDDGQTVVFASRQPNLDPRDYNGEYDVFACNVSTGTNELISARAPSLPSRASNGRATLSAQPLSADGRFLTFASDGDDLVPGDTNQFGDIFVCDLLAGTNLLASVTSNGVSAAGLSYGAVISGDGRYVAFTSAATNLIVGDTNNHTDVFLRDLQAATTSVVSVRSVGGVGNFDSYSPTISADGRIVLFVSRATNLLPVTFSGGENLFVRVMDTGKTYAMTTTGLTSAAMTPDGRFVAFADTAGGSAGTIYLWDTQLSRRVATNQVDSPARSILFIGISRDGNRVAWFAESSGKAYLIAWDRVAGQSSTVAGAFNQLRSRPRMSATGRFLAYAVTPGLTTNQIYLYDFQTQTNVLVSHAWNSSQVAHGTSGFARHQRRWALRDLSERGR